jgi:hypothetical protein
MRAQRSEFAIRDKRQRQRGKDFHPHILEKEIVIPGIRIFLQKIKNLGLTGL